MKRTYHIGVNVLHINNGDKTLCGIVPDNKYPYDLDKIKRLGLMKPLCQHCQRKAINYMFEKGRKG